MFLLWFIPLLFVGGVVVTILYKVLMRQKEEELARERSEAAAREAKK